MEGSQEPSDREVLNMETAMAEIKMASPELADFLHWCAHQDDLDQEEFNVILGATLGYAHNKNDPARIGATMDRINEEGDTLDDPPEMGED